MGKLDQALSKSCFFAKTGEGLKMPEVSVGLEVFKGQPKVIMVS